MGHHAEGRAVRNLCSANARKPLADMLHRQGTQHRGAQAGAAGAAKPWLPSPSFQPSQDWREGLRSRSTTSANLEMARKREAP